MISRRPLVPGWITRFRFEPLAGIELLHAKENVGSAETILHGLVLPERPCDTRLLATAAFNHGEADDFA